MQAFKTRTIVPDRRAPIVSWLNRMAKGLPIAVQGSPAQDGTPWWKAPGLYPGDRAMRAVKSGDKSHMQHATRATATGPAPMHTVQASRKVRRGDASPAAQARAKWTETETTMAMAMATAAEPETPVARGASTCAPAPEPAPASRSTTDARRLPYANRREAGLALADALAGRHWEAPPVVLALPRGGVPVAVEVALRLHAPMGLVMVRKLGAANRPELAVGALAQLQPELPPLRVTDDALLRWTGTTPETLARDTRRETAALLQRRDRYLAGRAPPALEGHTLILVDDGLATGATARAAARCARLARPSRLVLAVPVAPAEAVHALAAEVDEVLCLWQPSDFHAVGVHYVDFRQVQDEDVVAAFARLDTPAAQT
jgi:putative phosphoribosyl transferase